ncbi:TauD/TfdA family dioxygenase [Tenacibaculum sp. Ill]|uniref:TauD/TfdA family dioxygenase n=1 Tax=Tenacibaculum sp. Ill TaxID=3445935 RepID=UPI003F79DCEC
MLTKYNFKETIIFQQIIDDLRKGESIVHITHFPISDNDLSTFINQIGSPIHEYRNNDQKAIFDVKIYKQNNYFKSIANSNLAFPLHTDCADFESVPNCIGLLCVEPALNMQGINSFSSVDDILKKIPQKKLNELKTKNWRFRNRLKPIFQKNRENITVCYDRITIESFSKNNKEEIEELNRLDKLFEENSFQIMLRKGDLILFRNDLFLHGRSSFEANSKRLIKRIRFDIK